MHYRKYLSGILAFAMVFNTGVVSASASGTAQAREGVTQVTSNPETVYVSSYGAGERSVSFNDNWRFYLGDVSGAEAVRYNDSSWDDVTLPHDYSIDQGFTTAAPAEGESGFVLGGTGWYRKSFTLTSDMQGKSISVDFDGVYMNATVYVNGTQLGTHPYGYTPFSYVLPSELLNYGGQDNVIAVKVEHQQPSSRWYSGSGIYRDVNLTVTDPVHVARYGTTVTTPDIEEGTGTVAVSTSVQNDTAEVKNVSLQQTVFELDGTEAVVTGEKTEVQAVEAGGTIAIEDSVTVPEPKLWSTETPNMYTLRTDVYEGGTLVDSYETDFGFRWVAFTRENGFFLNGENIKLQGMCMHHDQGSLGAEAWYRATERQVEILQDMGVNAIRVTHNPASTALIEICERKGVLLIDEAFDCWINSKNANTNDYAKWFAEPIEEDNQIVGKDGCDQWAEFDIKEMVKRGKNSPSIIMWSLGNEVFEGTSGANNNQYPTIANSLMEWISQEDTSRYVTFGDNKVKSNNEDAVATAKAIAENAGNYGLPGGLIGYNYGSSSQIQGGYNSGWMVYGSETASSVNSRGIYDRKASNSDGGVGDKMLTSYDKSCVGWGALASNGLWITMQQNYNAGEFVWTGFDYIGEPTPYNKTGTGSNGTWPVIPKNSYFGVIDTAGLPKDSFYLYQSQWNEEVNTLHVLPVWDEEEIVKDASGKVEVVVYSDAPVVKLYLNDAEVGTAASSQTTTPTGGYQNYTSGTGCFVNASGAASLYATFNVPYEEGKLEAKAFEADGETPITDTEGRSFVETTTVATKLAALADRTEITADGKDLSYVTIDVQDADGTSVNGEEPEITVSVSGNGKLMSLDNGVQPDITTYTDSTRKAGKGKLVAIVQSTKKAGEFTVTASAPGYVAASVKVTTKPEESISTDRVITSYEITKNYFVKAGSVPELPETVKVNYSDDTSETKDVTWEELPEGQKNYTVYGTVSELGLRVSVNVMTIEQVADVLNYSAAVGKDAVLTLPQSRPAVTADGTVLTAEFPVTWDLPADVTETLGTKVITGTAAVFDETMDVTASVRVTNGSYTDGSDAFPRVAEMYVGGESGNTDTTVAEAFDKLKDNKTTKDDVAWTDRNTIDVRFDTAINLKNFVFYIKDTAPTSDTMKVYSSGDDGMNWTEADCKVTNKRENGMTIRTLTPAEAISETWYRMEFTKTITLTEIEMNTQIPTFPIGAEAALSSLKVGERIADNSSLGRGSYGVPDTGLTEADVEAVGKDNASITILPKDAENVIRILMESEDHAVQGIFAVRLGQENGGSSDATDGNNDYPRTDMILSAPSIEPGGSVDRAKDNNAATIWHSGWGSGGVGPTDLSDKPEQRYIQMDLKEEVKIDAVRYLPRNSQVNGTVTEYRIEVSTDNENWVIADGGTGTWTTAAEWKLAPFTPVSARYIRLYGVQTATEEAVANKYMSAAEVRVRLTAKEIYAGNTTVTLGKSDQIAAATGSAITPEPTVVYGEEENAITLVKDTDYTLSYENNVEAGTATVIVTGKGAYTGVLKTNFTITPVEVEVTGYEEVTVTTARGTAPELPGTVVAHTNVGDSLMEVHWDKVGNSVLDNLGSFKVYGTVVETGERITATVTISDIIGVQQTTMAITAGTVPAMPEKVKVYYSNGDISENEVTWDLEGADFSQAGTVQVTGTVGTATATASIRLTEGAADVNSTPTFTNLSLNADGASKSTEWPRTFSFVGSADDLAHHATDGRKDFTSNSSKSIWCDWENGQFHTNTSTSIDVGAADRAPFLVTAFGVDGSTDNNDQKKYTVNKVSIGFMEEDGTGASKVRLPKDYKIEYYSGNNGVIAANRLSNGTAHGCSNVKTWQADNPVKAFEGWTEVAYVEKTDVPALADFKNMVDVYFTPVETTAIRITLTPQANSWVGLEEFEVYYEPVSQNSTYEITAINVDEENRLSEFSEDTKTLNVNAASGTITAEATNNGSVTVLQAVNGIAKVIFLPENGDESGKQEYTVNFTASQAGVSNVVSAANEAINLETGTAKEGDTVTFTTVEGYVFSDTPVIVKSEDNAATEISVVKENEGYSFAMPDYPVTITGEVKPIEYSITYILGGGTAEGNPEVYTIETRTFTLKNPVREGYTFLGWTSDGTPDPVVGLKVSSGTKGNLIFAANWREGTAYKVTFDSKGGTAVPPQEVPCDAAVVTEPKEPSRRGYIFGGWFTDEECKHPWSFAEDVAVKDMTLYAKWTEAKVKVNSKIPACRINQPFNMPGNINISVGTETFDTNVIWNTEDLEALASAEETGKYTVKGTLEGLDNREISVQVPKSIANVVYFVDSGATAFTQKGQALVEANEETIRNSSTDQSYTVESGWGFTTPEDQLEANGSGDAYESVRNFNGFNSGKTLSYKFAMDAGNYDVTIGFYNYWLKYANGKRNANIIVRTDDGTALASRENYLIGEKGTVELKDVSLDTIKDLNVDIVPVNSTEENPVPDNDVMVSFILITKKSDAQPVNVTFQTAAGSIAAEQTVLENGKLVRPADPVLEGQLFKGWFKDEDCTVPWDFDTDTVSEATVIYAKWVKADVPDLDIKAGLRAAIDVAAGLKAADYTEESYRKLADAIAAAEGIYEAEGQTTETINAQIDALVAAIRGLESSYKSENESLSTELAELQGQITSLTEQLSEKENELDSVNATVTSLSSELSTANDNVATLNSQIAALEEQLENAPTDAEVTELQDQIAALTDQKETAERRITELEGQLAAAETVEENLRREVETLGADLNKAKGDYETLLEEKAAADKALQDALDAAKKAEEEKLAAEKAKAAAEAAAEQTRKELEALKESLKLKTGDTAEVNGIMYRVTDADKKLAQAYGAKSKKAAGVKVAATVKIKDVTCKVTGIADKAFASMKKLKTVVLGKNVTVIGKRAFYGDSKLVKITIAGKKLSTVGSKAFKGISKKAVIKVPKAKKKVYTKLLKGKGQMKTVKIK